MFTETKTPAIFPLLVTKIFFKFMFSSVITLLKYFIKKKKTPEFFGKFPMVP